MEHTNSEMFNQLGLELIPESVEQGKTYWIYGCITDFFEETEDSVIVELNFSVKAKISLSNSVNIEILKSRLYETGIFVCTVLSNMNEIFVDCETVIFGKKKTNLV